MVAMGILFVSLIMLTIMTVMGIIILVVMKMAGYQPKDMEECWEENYDEKLRKNVD